ncbi:MAG: hypothetical protein AABZ61_04505, partial [Bacteroidota bacterium]
MESKQTTVVKILVFLFIGIVFVAAIIAYSNAPGRGEKFVEDGWIRDGFGEGQRRIDKVFDVRPGGELVVDTDVGSVSVETWDKDQVSIVLEMSGDEQQLKRFKVEFSTNDSSVSVVGKQRERFFPWHWQSADIVFRAKVPKRYRPRVSTSGGDVTI